MRIGLFLYLHCKSTIFGQDRSVDKADFGCVARFGCRSFVRIAESDTEQQFITFGETEFLDEIRSGRAGVHEPCRSSETAGAYAH